MTYATKMFLALFAVACLLFLAVMLLVDASGIVAGGPFLKIMIAATTAVCTTYKSELFCAGHCHWVTQTGVSATGSNGAFTLTALASTAGISVGMAVTGTNVAAGAVVASVDSASQVTLSKAHTGAVTSVTF